MHGVAGSRRRPPQLSVKNGLQNQAANHIPGCKTVKGSIDVLATL